MDKRRDLYNKKYVKRDNIIPLSRQSRPTVGFGYISLPDQMSRDEYLAIIKRTGYCQIITDFNEIINSAVLPIHLMDEIEIPAEPRSYGSLVSWLSVEKSGQVIVSHIHLKPGQMHFLGENKTTKHKVYNKTQITECKDVESGNYLINVTTDQQEGSIKLNINGTSIELIAGGDIKITSNNTTSIIAEDNINIMVGNQDIMKRELNISNDNVELTFGESTVKITSNQLQLDSPLIKLGKDADQFTIKGEKLISFLIDLIKEIQLITVGTSAGPSTIPINNPQFIALQGKINQLISMKTKIE